MTKITGLKKWKENTGNPDGCHLSFSQVVVDHREVEAQLLHVTFIALEEKKVAIHLRVQWRQVVDVHICTGAQKFREKEAGKRQLHQHVLVQRLQKNTKGRLKDELLLVALKPHNKAWAFDSQDH